MFILSSLRGIYAEAIQQCTHKTFDGLDCFAFARNDGMSVLLRDLAHFKSFNISKYKHAAVFYVYMHFAAEGYVAQSS